MATKRSIKPFSRNPRNKTHVLASKSSQKKAVITFQQKEAQQVKLKRLSPKKVLLSSTNSDEFQPKQPVKLAVPTVIDLRLKNAAIEEQTNKLEITKQLLEIAQTLKAVKAAEREQCAKRIYAAETKAIAKRAAVYRKAKQAGKFPVSWVYPKPEVQPPFGFKAESSIQAA